MSGPELQALMKLHEYGSWCQLQVLAPTETSLAFEVIYEEYQRCRDISIIQKRMMELLDQWSPNKDAYVDLYYWSHNQPYHTFKLTRNRTSNLGVF